MYSHRQQNYTEIYELLRKLCKSLAGDRYGPLLKSATQLIANTPNSISASAGDESSLVARIGLLLGERSQSDGALFRGLHEEMSAYTDSKRRAQVLEFLLLLANSEGGSGGTNGLMNLQSDLSGSSRSSGTDGGPSGGLEGMFSKIELRTTRSSESTGASGLRIVPCKDGASMLTLLDGRSSTTSGELSEEEGLAAACNLENQLIQDVLYACAGIQGKYLRKHVVTGEFKLDHIKGRTLDAIDAGMLLQLAMVGNFHNQVVRFTDPKSDCYMKGNYGQGYIAAVQRELTNYYGMLAILQEDLNRQQRERNGAGGGTGTRLTLMKLKLWLANPMERLQWLGLVSESCKELKGGALATVVHDYTTNGHPENRKLAVDLLRSACIPLQQALIRWLLDGEIVDPNCEFFIEEISEVGFDQLWHQKYRIRKSMLPKFVSDTVARKILVIGKSINYLREVCQDKTPVKARNDLKQCLENDMDSIFSPISTTKLHRLIDSFYLDTSKRVLDIVLGPQQLLHHLQTIRNFILLGQGNFADILMENLHSELDRPANEIFQHDLFSILAAAIRISSEQEEPEVLSFLDVHYLTHYEGESGWDVFGLTYKVCGPLATILEPSLCRYQTFFKQLWNMKHIEFILSRTWKLQILNAKSLKPLQSLIAPTVHRLQLTTSQMINFISQMQYYILFEVIECSWVQFLPRVNQANALDDIIEAHHQFLEEIRIGIFLDESSQQITNTLEHVFNTVRKLQEWQERFYRLCNAENDARRAYQDHIRASERTGNYGVTTELMLERDEEAKTFEQHLSTHRTLLQDIGNEYENFVRQFLYQLTISTSETLRQFGMRLDYNEYYKHQDRRLNDPLTFQHIRMSAAANSFRNSRKAATTASSMLY